MSPHVSRRRILRLLAGSSAAAVVAGNPTLQSAVFAQEPAVMSPQKKAESLGITFEKAAPGYLNKCVKSGNWLITSGHTSKIKGKLGADLEVKQGAEAARECAIQILQSVWNTHGTLDGLKVLKVLGCVNCTPDFIDQPLVINGCSDLLHEVFGKETDGYHARSALGFASLPSGVAVEVEAIFEIKG
jgi:enamine deaminase RidA (YjgF/YER057c/UK114 family)